MGKLTIYCCYHDKTQKKDDDKLTIWFYGPDGLLNPYLSEFSMFYDIRKNDKDSDYIGTCHYRRRIYSGDFNEKLVNENSCQVYEIIKGNRWSGAFGIENWTSDKWRQCKWLRIDYSDYINGKYGTNNKYIKTDKLVGQKTYKMISRSSFILTRGHFMNMCDYIFGFLDYLDKKYNLNYSPKSYNDWLQTKYIRNINWLPFAAQTRLRDMKRLLAYLFERMSSIYITANLKNYHLLQSELCYCFPRTGGMIEYKYPNIFKYINNYTTNILNFFYEKCKKY